MEHNHTKNMYSLFIWTSNLPGNSIFLFSEPDNLTPGRETTGSLEWSQDLKEEVDQNRGVDLGDAVIHCSYPHCVWAPPATPTPTLLPALGLSWEMVLSRHPCWEVAPAEENYLANPCHLRRAACTCDGWPHLFTRARSSFFPLQSSMQADIASQCPILLPSPDSTGIRPESTP